MALFKQGDSVIIDSVSFSKFMDYRYERNLATNFEWMHLPPGTMLEVKDLIFRTTGSKKKKRKFINENGEDDVKYTRGRSCWVKCSIVTPLRRNGEIHIIPSWILQGSLASHESSAKAV